jgi:hypothetical protein
VADERSEPGFFAQTPVLFPGVRVYRGLDHNVLPECERVLGLACPEWWGDPTRLGDGREAKSFRSSESDSTGRFELKTAWDQLVYFFAGSPEYDAKHAFQIALWRLQKRYWPAFAGFLKAMEFLSEHFPWARHAPSTLGMALFVKGPLKPFLSLGRHLWRLTHRNRTPTRVVDGSAENRWEIALRDPLFAPLKSASVVLPPKSAVSA